LIRSDLKLGIVNSNYLNIIVPITFELDKTRERLAPILAEKFKSNAQLITCKLEEGEYLCSHLFRINLPPRSIIGITSFNELRQYTSLVSYANVGCVDFEIQQALFNIGLIFDVEDYHLWKELLRLGRLEDVLWLEHATAEHNNSPHPSFVGDAQHAAREEAKAKHLAQQLATTLSLQSEFDKALDEQLDRARYDALIAEYDELRQIEYWQRSMRRIDPSETTVLGTHIRADGSIIDLVSDDVPDLNSASDSSDTLASSSSDSFYWTPLNDQPAYPITEGYQQATPPPSPIIRTDQYVDSNWTGLTEQRGL
jgi:hypothetical protein